MKNEKVLALVKKARKKNKAAFARLCELKVNEVIFLCTREMGNAQDGQDAAQEVFVQMQKSILTLNAPEAFNVWLNRLVHYTCLTMRRDSMKHKDSMRSESFEEFLMDETLASLPEDFVEKGENKRRIIELIEELPAKYRECIVLHYYQSLSYDEVAKVLDISADAVNNNMRMARKYLKRKLEAEASEKSSSKVIKMSMLALGPMLSKSLLDAAAISANAALAEQCLISAGVYTAFAGGAIASGTILSGLANIAGKTAIQAAVASVVALAGLGVVGYNIANHTSSVAPSSVVSQDAGFPQNSAAEELQMSGEEAPLPSVQNILSGRVYIKQNENADPDALTGVSDIVLELVSEEYPNEVIQTVKTLGGKSNGEFKLAGMADGKYRLRIYLPMGATVTKNSEAVAKTEGDNEKATWLALNNETEFELVSGQTVIDNLNIELDYPSVLTGKIRLSLGGVGIAYDESQLPEIYMILLDPQKKEVGKALVNGEGEYQFENPFVCQKGDYTLRVQADNANAVQLEIADSKVQLWPGYGI